MRACRPDAERTTWAYPRQMRTDGGTIAVTATAETAVVTVTGDLDLSVRAAAEHTLEQVEALRRPTVLVDVQDMGFMDSTGAAMVIGLAHACHCRGGCTVLRGASERDLFVLAVRGALDLFDIDDDAGHASR